MRTCLIPEAPAEWIGRFQATASARRIPLEGTMELTRRCNLNCIHCYLGGNPTAPASEREMSTADARGVIDQLAEAGTLHLTLTGGEPLLRADFAEVYAHAVTSGLFVKVFSNATLVDARFVRLFQRFPPRQVEITMNGSTPGAFESITRVPGSFIRFREGVRLLLDGGIRISLKAVVMSLNHHEIDAIEAFARECGVPFRYDTALFPGLPDSRGVQRPAAAALAALRVSPEQAVSIDTASPERKKNWLAALGSEPSPQGSRRLYRCGAGLTNFHVDHEGFLTPCLLVTAVRHDLKTASFAAGWDGPIFAVRRLEARAGFPCADCKAGSLCGSCPALSALEEGAPDLVPDYHCRTGRKRFDIFSDDAML